jgi:hypothetical protein
MEASGDEPTAGEPYWRNTRNRVYFYVAETEERLAAARVELRVSNRYVINGALTLAVLIALLMTALAIAAGPIVQQNSPSAVTLLLLVPGLLGYLVSRPGEHPLVRRHVVGVRLLILAAAAIPLTAALVLNFYSHPGAAIQLWWGLLAAGSWLIVLLLTLSWLLPVGAPSAEEE